MKHYDKVHHFIRLMALLILLALSSGISFGQKKTGPEIVVSGHGWYGVDIERTRPNLKSYGYMTYEAAVGFQTSPSDSCSYNHAFGFPMISVGLSVAQMGNFQFYDQTRFPNLYSVYGSFERTAIREKHFSFGYQLDFGMTYNPERYDPVNNPGNNWLSFPVMAYFSAGPFAKLHLGKRWEIGADLLFRHFSNGRLALPNEALNAIGGGIFARYRLSDYDYRRYEVKEHSKPQFEKGMQYMIALGGGLHSCMAEWNAYVETETDPAKKDDIHLRKHPKLSLSIEALYRYSLRYASGISLEMFYSSNMKDLERSDRIVYGDEVVDKCPGYNPISVGLAFVQEVYWKNLAAHVSIGAYPYRRKGVNGPEAEAIGDRERGWHYEKAGLRYYMPKFGDTFVGFAIKSHSIKAEYLEFSVGIRL